MGAAAVMKMAVEMAAVSMEKPSGHFPVECRNRDSCPQILACDGGGSGRFRHPKLCEFVKKQEACRKDVERAFGVLQQRFAVVRFPAMTWSKDQMWEVMNCCVCLHNMIIENERKHPVPLAEQEAPYEREGPLAQPNHQVPPSWAAFIAMRQEIRDSTMHQLQDDLVEHIWRLRGNNADAN
ncbi:hypothetical protein QYE76_003989 [Lolium multiflorum]|uniref:DDE Tnp4 domain-containing protein n=1 Tax=Lolium multiflorum TaxID=4521 RepID=A0AAD8W0Z7_LOLMU|nr:hypothetical protein QYE76_003989 [Lolium multiflorum]